MASGWAGNRKRIAPLSAVLSTVVPAARQRATTSGMGMPQRLPKPAEAIPRRADTAAINSGVDELRLP